jgi:hypothetical protein
MGITSVVLFLPVSVLKTNGEFKPDDGRLVPLFPSYGLCDLLEALSRKLGSNEQIIPFFENDRKEIFRIDEHTDLRLAGAIRLRAVVGIIPKACKECKMAFNSGVAPEFHCCVRDEPISGFCFRSTRGPIQRSHDMVPEV